MIIYELTTNATKYGALAHQFGRLDASIKRTAKDAFAFEQREHRPRASIQTAQWSKGFGSTLIDYCTRTLDAELEREILETGVSYKMTIALSSNPTKFNKKGATAGALCRLIGKSLTSS